MRYSINAKIYRENLYKNNKIIKEALHVKEKKDEKNSKKDENNETLNETLYIKKDEKRLTRDE